MTHVPSADIYPHISLPLATASLRQPLSLLKIALKHNFINGLLIIAGSVMAAHYSAVIRVNSGCPMVITSGPSETGKLTAIRSALSLTGNHHNSSVLLLNHVCVCLHLFYHLWYILVSGARHSIYVKGSNAFFLERASLSSLPFAIDDPPKTSKSGGCDISDLVLVHWWHQECTWGKWGRSCQKDFLRPGATSCTVQRGKTDKKRRCVAFFLHHLPPELVKKLRKGNFHLCIQWCTYYFCLFCAWVY